MGSVPKTIDLTRNLQNLTQARVGCDLQIEAVDGPACDQLRNLGFCESLPVRKLAQGRNLVCSVCGTRVALSQELGKQVLVSSSES